MKTFVALAAAGLFGLSIVTAASACEYGGKVAEISKPLTTAEAPITTPKPKPEG